MCRQRFRITIAMFLVFACFALAAEDSTVTFGGASGWKPFSVSRSLARGTGQLGYESLILDSSSASTASLAETPAGDRLRVGAFDSIYGGYGGVARRAGLSGGARDLVLSFDGENPVEETGNYAIISSALLHTGAKKARRGNGAALCNTAGSGLTLRGKPGALFSTPGTSGSFSVEFWLFPAVTENGSVLFQWRSSRKGSSGSMYQYVRSSLFKNHVEWDFSNIWVTTKGVPIEVSLSGKRNLIPNQWSHHEISYDQETGLLEYRLDGSTEDLRYVTSSAHERGDIYPAIFGTPADIEIAPRYSGLIDEFLIARTPPASVSLNRNRSVLGKYPEAGGRFETMPFDTGGNESTLKSLKAVVSCPPETGAAFFVRAGDNFYEWNDTVPAWIPVSPGEELMGITGRYFQVAGELYADGRGASTPSVTSVTLSYSKDTPPWPPAHVYTAALDGSVTLSWPASIDFDTAGYLVYYGERPGEYLGSGSPIEAGPGRSCEIRGLKNGTIYYFTVAAYDASGPGYPGPLSAEVYARPLAARQP